RELVRADLPFVRRELPRAEAIRLFRERGEPFKVEILEGIDADPVSLYRQGEFEDLCRGPHVPSTGHVTAFKLLSSSGAYWRGDERNPMLQRIYGTAWLTPEELDRHLWRLEEAKKRDHRKLGRELDLFDFFDVAPGAPFWLPKGMVLVRELERFARESLDARGYQEIATPMLIHKRLWEQSGHWEHYQDNMFQVEVEGQLFTLKPMNCPPSAYVYRRALRSYRDLPLRFSEMGRCHRNERSGTLTGLVRVRQFTQDDAHIYCRPDQLEDEITALLELVREWYKVFTLEPSFKLSTRPEKYLGTPEQWNAAEHALHTCSAGAGRSRPSRWTSRCCPSASSSSTSTATATRSDRWPSTAPSSGRTSASSASSRSTSRAPSRPGSRPCRRGCCRSARSMRSTGARSLGA
ncbi:MAG: hypothetical protein DME06_18805, partial [Candidatus Rokuibacteriota bacterium]